MKVQVKDKQGIDEAGNKYPAVIKVDETSKICDWLLSEYEEEFRNRTGKFYHSAPMWVAEAIKNYTDTHVDTASSTRIAELSARVAELEGALREVSFLHDFNEDGAKAKRIAHNALKNQQP